MTTPHRVVNKSLILKDSSSGWVCVCTSVCGHAHSQQKAALNNCILAVISLSFQKALAT